MHILQKVIKIHKPEERKKGLIVLILVVLMAIIEAISIASIAPFLSLLGNNDLINANPYLIKIFEYVNNYGIETHLEFLIFLGFCSLFFIIFSSVYKIIVYYLMNKYIESQRYILADRLTSAYTYQPYNFFLKRDSTDLAKTVISEVDNFNSNIVRPIIKLTTHFFLILMLFGLVFYINELVAILTIIFFLIIYFLIYFFFKRKIDFLGQKRLLANQNRFKVSSELFKGIKSLKIYGCEEFFLSNFYKATKSYSQSQLSMFVRIQSPKFLIEAFVFGGIIAIVISLMVFSNNQQNVIGEILPTLGVMTFALYRIHPASQEIFKGMTSLRYGAAAINSIYEDLFLVNGLQRKPKKTERCITANHTIVIENLNFNYADSSNKALRNINFKIQVGESIGIAGPTGSGKTTFIDLILGLLQPSSGNITIDQKILNESELKSWRETIGYVPQDIFLNDSTIAENIAIGKSVEDIDMEKIKFCCEIAQLDDFINKKLENKYLTRVGENGIRISGGERQRLGIARALYRNPSLLIFDEATSALDEDTQDRLIASINKALKGLTMIFVAHRVSTLKKCDRILLLVDGEIDAVGSYDQLINSNSIFREYARTS